MATAAHKKKAKHKPRFLAFDSTWFLTGAKNVSLAACFALHGAVTVRIRMFMLGIVLG